MPVVSETHSTDTTRGRNPWALPPAVTPEILRAAEDYLAGRPLEEQIAVLTLIREVEHGDR